MYNDEFDSDSVCAFLMMMTVFGGIGGFFLVGWPFLLCTIINIWGLAAVNSAIR